MLKPLLFLEVLLYRIWLIVKFLPSLKSEPFFKSSLIFCLAVFFLLGCSEKKGNTGDAERVKQKWKEAANETKEYLDNEGESFKRDVDATISELDNKIKDLKHKLSSKSGKGRDKVQKQIDDLEVKKNDLRDELEKAGDNAKESWDKFKNGTRRALSDIEKEIDSLK
jgi:septal ring factor EnvC (AmiA/AmiB activator)